MIYPEFGSTFLGTTALDSLNEIHLHINSTVDYFINFKNDDAAKTLSTLQKQRTSIRKKVALSKTVLTESTFEITYSYMAPKELKPIVKLLGQASASTSAIVGACELEYALLGKDYEKAKKLVDGELHHGISREIEHADAAVLLAFLDSISEPVLSLSRAISMSFNCIKLAVSYGYDVPDSLVKIAKINDDTNHVSKASNNENRDKITLDAIDKTLKLLVLSITNYDSLVPQRLESAAHFEVNEADESNGGSLLLPRDEYFLVSSFLLNFREFANIISSVLSNSREIVEHRSMREDRGFFGRSLWFFPVFSKKTLHKYLWTGENDLKEVDIASVHTSKSTGERVGHYETEDTQTGKFRNILADFVEFPERYSAHIKFSFKYTILLMLVSFPAFSASMRTWYVDIKGTWVGFVANLVIESSVGETAMLFVIRTIGLVIGAAWGYAAYEAGWSGTTPGGDVVMCVVIVVGLIVGYYFMLASPYPKAAMVGIVSSTIVVLSTIYPVTPSTIRENFAKRCIAMLIGGAAAVVVQITLFPVKARSELVNQIVSCLECCEKLEEIVAQGVDGGSYRSTQQSYAALQKIWKQANKSLALAESFRKYYRTSILHRYINILGNQAKKEPRLKGSFGALDTVFAEIIFVLYQIIDKFHNIAFLRQQYGSAILEDLSVSTC
ncbi:hypothetical protein AWJ20_2831 [Sugiyamaella lignohabitans]|uniref:Uncharacterized protein n=1 Tax=Sugiyamaella lignohabitans TaxID=796027 RepID=A0A161HMS6_9ASCO|nr:uncharacterized protein AWJ20_2831 [Sugiyamaella lignohabitans]ANB15207.1 hypothetical protein AWJ20_2831 [Sugiyamaella lignohabitans]